MDALDRERVLDMLEYSQAAIRIAGSADAAALRENEVALFALSYALQVVGEAANKVSSKGKAALPDVPWPDIVSMRHRLVHGYRLSNPDVLADTVRNDLPGLVAALERALQGK